VGSEADSVVRPALGCGPALPSTFTAPRHRHVAAMVI